MNIKRSQAGVTCSIAMLALAGCGGGATREARQLNGIGILEKTKPLGQNLVRQSDIGATSDASGAKTLLQFWSTLQDQDYESATNFFYSRLANFVGVAQLALALKSDGSLWSSTKPEVVKATTSGGTARVTFVIRNLLNDVTPVTVSFRKEGPSWKINYLSLLDEALRSYAQQYAESQPALRGSQPTKLGLAAGARAFRLQSEYLQTERTGSAEARKGKAGGGKGP